MCKYLLIICTLFCSFLLARVGDKDAHPTDSDDFPFAMEPQPASGDVVATIWTVSSLTIRIGEPDNTAPGGSGLW